MPADPLTTDALVQRLKTGVPLSHAEQMDLAEILGRGPAQDIANRLEAQAAAMRNAHRRPNRGNTPAPVDLPGLADLPRLISRALRRIAAARRQDEHLTRSQLGQDDVQPVSRAAARRAAAPTAAPTHSQRRMDRGIR